VLGTRTTNDVVMIAGKIKQHAVRHVIANVRTKQAPIKGLSSCQKNKI
jgi:hypothetical protein